MLGYITCAVSYDINYNNMKGLKNFSAFLAAAAFILALSLAAMASTSSNFTNGGAPAAYFKVSSYNLVLNVTLPDGTNGGAEDSLLRDGSVETWSGYALAAFNGSTYFVNASTGETFSGSQSIIYDVNGNGIYNSGTDIVMTGSAPADGSLLGNTWGNAKFAGTTTFDSTSDIYDSADNTVGKKTDKVINIVFENSGTATDTDITLRVWNDTDNNSIFDRFTDKQIGLPSAIGPTKWNLTDGFLIQAGGRRLFVTADISTSANGKTIQLGIPINGMSVASNNDGPTNAAVVNANVQTADTSSPSIISSSITPSSPVRTDTLLNASCTDNTPRTVSYNIDSGSNTTLTQTGGSFTGTISISSVPDGGHTINIFCVDSAGNEATGGLAFTVDKTAPAVSLFQGFLTTINSTVNNNNLSFNGSFSDNTTNLQSGDYALDGGSPVSLPALNGSYGNDRNINFSFSLSLVSQGQHAVSVRAFDAPGNIGNASYGFFVDTMVPLSSVNSTQAYFTTRMLQLPYSSNDSSQSSGIQNVTLYYRINQTGSFVQYANTTNGTFNFDATALGDGFYEFYTIARDNAGNVEAAPSTADANTTIDTILPFILSMANAETPEFTNASDMWFRQSSHGYLSFTAFANDTTSGVQQCNAGWSSTILTDNKTLLNIGSGSVIANFSSAGDDVDATVNVTISCTDRAGLQNRSSILIRLDGTAPAINSIQWLEASNYLYVNSTGALIYSSTMPSVQTATANGSSTDSGSGNTLYFGNVTFSAAFGDGGGGTTTPWALNYTIDSSDNGNGTVVVTVRDNAGNSNSSSLRFAEDNAPPAFGVTSPNGGERLAGGSAFTITWTPASDENGVATNNITIEYSNGAAWTLVAAELPNTGSYTWSVPSININQAVIRINASDIVQNIGSDTSNATFIIDSSAPTATAFTNDTNANGRLDRIELQFSEPVNVTSASGISVAGYTITGAYSSFNVTNLSLVMTEGGFDTNATPLVNITSPVIFDLSGNALLQNMTPSDRARPVLLMAKTNDTNLNGKIDVVMMNFSEPVDNAFAKLVSANSKFAVAGYSGQTFTAIDNVAFNNTAVLNATPTSTFVLQLGFTEGSSFDTSSTPVLNATAGALVDMSSNGLVPASGFAVADGASPYMANATTRDSDGNGKIDNITITFTETLQTTSVNPTGTDFSVAGYTIINANRSWSALGIVNISVQEKSYYDSSETPQVSIAAGQKINDLSGNNSITSGIVTPADRVRPVVASTSGVSTPLKAGSYVFNATFSEAVTGAMLFANSTRMPLTALNSTFWNGTIGVNGSVTDGPHFINITGASDASGNAMLNNASLSFLSDQTLPLISINSPLPITYNVTGNVTLNATFSEAVDTCIAELNGLNATFVCNTLSSVMLAEGVNTIRVWANDTAGNLNSAAVSVQFNPHTLPSVTSVGLLPSPANITDVLNASAVIDFTTSSAGNVSFFWYRNGAFVTNNTLTGITNSSNITNIYNGTKSHFDNITAEIRPYKTAKGFGNFQNVTIQVSNAAPVMTPPSIPTFLNVTSNMSASVLYSDADGDVGNVVFKFYNNSVFFRLTNVTGITSGTNVSSNLTITGLRHFDNWTADAVASDGLGGTTLNITSPAIRVSNTPPATGSPSLLESQIYTNSTIACIPSGSSDADGDPLTNMTLWLVNGTAVLQNSSTLDGATYFNRGDSVSCQITPNDGFINGNAANSTIITIQDTPPTIPASLSSDRTKAGGYSSLFTFMAGGSIDNDTDTIIYQFETNHTGVYKNIGNSSGSVAWNVTNLTSGLFNLITRSNTTLNVSGYLSSAVTFEVDNTPPSIMFLNQTPQNGGIMTTNDTFINVSVSDANIDKVMLNWNGTLFQINQTGGGYAINITSQPDGAYRFNVTANDTLGNTAATETRNITIFSAQPRVVLMGPTPANDSYINTTSFTINTTVIRQNIDKVYANVSGSIIFMTNTTSNVFNATIIRTDGTYSYYVFANDTSGAFNISEMRLVRIDTAKPSINNVNVTSDRTIVRLNSTAFAANSIAGIGAGQNITFSVSATDVSPLNLTVANGTQLLTDASLPFNVTLLVNAAAASFTKNLTLSVSDAAGNVNSSVIQIIFDNTPPVVAYSVVETSDLLHFSNVIYFGSLTSVQFTINGTSSDSTGLASFFSSSPYANVSSFDSSKGIWSVAYTLTNESQNGTITINITDAFDMSSEIIINATKDTAAPSAPSMSAMSSFISYAPNLSWTTAADAGSGTRGYAVMRSRDGQNFTDASGTTASTSFNDTSAPEGLLFYKIAVVDSVNNTNVSLPVNTTVDLLAPLIASINATKLNDIGTLVNITANITDIAGVNSSLVNLSVLNNTGSVVFSSNMTLYSSLYNATWNTTNLTEGLYYLQINVSDVLSRTRNADKAAVILLTAPSTSLAKPQTIFTNSSVSAQPNQTTSVATDANLTLDIVTNSSATGSVNVLSYNTNPVGSTSGAATLRTLNKYYDIQLSSELNTSLSNATIRISYTDAEISAAGIDESSLKIYLWTGSAWQEQASSVDAAANIVSATVPHFSIYSTFGSAPAPAPSAPSVSGGGGGGGGGFSACIESWTCTSYSACSADGAQKRTCVDKNRCGTVRSKPAETQPCIYTATPACGNGIVETGEECDSVPQACSTGDGYIGKQACSTTCNAGICIAFEKCGDGVCNGPETSSICPSDCKPGEAGGAVETPTGQAISQQADPLLSAILIAGAIIIVFTAWRIMRGRRAKTTENRRKR